MLSFTTIVVSIHMSPWALEIRKGYPIEPHLEFFKGHDLQTSKVTIASFNHYLQTRKEISKGHFC